MKRVPHWTRGDQIVYREVWKNRIWTARPVTVVQDTSKLIVLYLSAGTHWNRPAPVDEDKNIFHHYLLKGRWSLVEQVWRWDSLILIPPGEAHAVHIMRGEEKGSREFVGWYINLQEPLRRTPIGFDFMDQELDIVVKPDLSEWGWKDEASFEKARELKLFSEDEAGQIRAEGAKMILRIETKELPFNRGWEKWYPPVEWPVPSLPEGWDSL